MNRTIAVIMAGGKGTRLMPITSELPKPLAQLLGKPAIFYILDLLEKHGLLKAVLTLGYKGLMLRDAVLNDRENHIDLDFSFEDTPLGTAGGVRQALIGINNDDYDDILVISGDAICDFNLSKAMEFHKSKNSIVTIVGKRVLDPREYGLMYCKINTDSHSERIEEFVEKPSYHSCCTDLASTGVYILSKEALNFIEGDGQIDFAKDVFSKIMDLQKSIYAYEENGYWCDIGDIKSYIQCQKDILYGLVNCKIDATMIDSVYYADGYKAKNIDICYPAYIGRNVSIAATASIGEGSIIGDYVSIGENCTVSGGILLNSVYLADESSVINAVCCEGAHLERASCVGEGSVVGGHAVIKSGAMVLDGAKVWHGKTVFEGHILREDLQVGMGTDIIVDEDGITGQINVVITPSLCAKVGSGVASLKKGACIGVGYSGRQGSTGLYYAVTSGIISAGANAWSFGECTQNQFIFCMGKSLVEYGVYIDCGAVAKIKIFDKGGLPSTRMVERKLEAAINRGEYLLAAPNEMGLVIQMSNLNELYPIEIVKLCNKSLNGIGVRVKSPSKAIANTFSKILYSLGCTTSDEVEIVISKNGEQVTINLNGNQSLQHEQILALVCFSDLSKGEIISVPQTAPMAIDKIAENLSGSVLRYCECSCDEKDKLARKIAMNKPYLRDALMMTVKLFSFMKERNFTFTDLFNIIPEFFTTSRLVAVSVPPSVVLKRLECEKSPLSEGVRVQKNGMSALIRPIKSGKGLMIFSESIKSETAMEICDVFEEIINLSGK